MGSTNASEEWWQEFVSAMPAHTAKLAVAKVDGSPHVVPVCTALDGKDVMFLTAPDSVKGKAILRDPRVSLCWDDERPPFGFVTVAGIATISTDSADLLYWATRIASRYFGPERAEEYGKRNAVPPEMLIRVEPSRIATGANVAD